MVLLLGWKISWDSSMFVGFTNGACCHTQNLTSTACVIYFPMIQLITFKGTCLGPYTNNVVEYSVVFKLLHDTIMHGIHSLEVHLDA